MTEVRVWSPDHECMFYQSNVFNDEHFDFRVVPDGLELLVLEEKWSSGSGEWVAIEEFVAQDNAVFMRHTGLYYRGGIITEQNPHPNDDVKCFEGDVCRVDGIGVCTVVIHPFYGVGFEDHECDFFAAVDSIAERDRIEFLGDKFQNPELLEQSK